MKVPKYPHVAKALAYARDVVAGKIVACMWVRLACRRHLDDLKRADFDYRYDPEKAERVCKFVELMPHTKGKWAAQRLHLTLEPWQCFFVCVLYGWLSKATGFRRFTHALLLVPRKNGKSPLAAALGLYGFAAEREHGAEVYSGATSEKQAWEVFRPARLMAKQTPAFLAKYGVEVGAKTLHIVGNGSRFEPLIGKPGDGASPSVAIVDEYHEHTDSTLYDAMDTGMVGREQALMLVITTAGVDIGSSCHDLVEKVRGALEGTEPNDRLFGIEYGIDEGDDWTSEAALKKANPNYGISVNAERVRAAQIEATGDAGKQNTFKTKHLNIWCSARSPWMNMEWWSKCADAPDEIEFSGSPVVFGSDLASRLDLASVARVYCREVEGEKHFYAYARHYCPRSRVEEPGAGRYQKWEHDGHLTATDSNDTDYEIIAADISGQKDDGEPWTHGGDGRRGMFAGIFVDPWNHRALTDRLKTAGIAHEEAHIVEVPQKTMHLSPPMKDLEAAVKAGRFHHTGDPVLGWAMSNVTVKPDGKDEIYPRKDRPENKIDPAVALILAFKGAQFLQPADTGLFVESV